MCRHYHSISVQQRSGLESFLLSAPTMWMQTRKTLDIGSIFERNHLHLFSMYLLIVDCILILIVVRTYPRRCGTRCRGSRGLCGKAAALRARGEATRHIVNLVPLLFCDRPHCWLHLNPVINYVLWLIACLPLLLIKCLYAAELAVRIDVMFHY